MTSRVSGKPAGIELAPVRPAIPHPQSHRRIRVIHLVLQLEFGGAESMVVLFAEHLPADRFEVEVWALNTGGGNVTRLSERGIQTRVLQKGRGFSRSALARLRALLREFRPDIVHAHNVAAARWSLFGTIGSGLAPVRIRTEHTFMPDRIMWQAIQHALIGGFFRRIVGVCDTVTSNHARIDRIWRKRYRTILNGIELRSPRLSAEKARAALGLPEDSRVVLNLGNLRVAKGQDVLIGAFAQLSKSHPDVRLVIVGEGSLRESLTRQAMSLGVGDRLILAGYRADAADLLVGANVVVQSSVREGMPVSLLEAARSARPIVATDVGGTREFIEHGVTGWLVPPRDVPSLYLAMREALDDGELANRMGVAAQQRLAERHDIVTATERLVSLYEEALGSRE